MKVGNTPESSGPRVQVTVAFGSPDAAFTPLLARLLREIDDSGSIAKAASRMSISYSHAWNVLGSAERALGCDLLERHGSLGSCLTGFGRDLLGRYEMLERAAGEFGRQLFVPFRGG